MKKLLKRKGFTLVECIVAIAIFALMSALVMQILALSIRQYRSNHHIEMDMDEQIKDIAEDNELIERETTDIAIEFIKDGGTGTVGEIKIDDVHIWRPEDTESPDRLELNTFDAVIKDDGGKDKNKQTGGMITDDIHCYGAKGITEITLSTTEETLDSGMKKITIIMQIEDGDYVLSSAECNAVKLALPGSAKNVKVTPDANTGYLRLSKTDESINYRFYDKVVSNESQNALFNATIVFEMTEDDYNAQYQSFAKYFIKPDSEETTPSATFDDGKTPGIYNNKI